MMQIEKRNYTTQLRAAVTDQGKTVEGYAAKFNVLSHDLGGFREILLPGCFELAPKVICNLEHDNRAMLGSSKSGTLTVTIDDVGLFFRSILPDTSDGQKAFALVDRKDLDECSFCFYLADDGSDETGRLGTTGRRHERLDTALLLT